PDHDNAASGDPIGELLDGEAVAEDAEEEAAPVVTPSPRQRRRASRRSRREQWRQRYGPFGGGIFGGR
ncbi:MAG: hypothetical protein AAGF09_07200, partial [Pseudomonadota bacterium]